MKNLITLLTIFTIILSGVASGDLLKSGLSIAEVRASMKNAGYRTTGLDVIATDRSHALEFWSVGRGVLSVRYSRKSNEVLGFGYTMSDERAKAYHTTR